jgi:NAD(P)-dependent dehydrogenase (short-subunit alcohol dehydrogenase family)
MKGKVGIVTGAGSPLGIGRSLVIALADAGARAVYACDLNMSNISSLQEEIKKRGHSCRVEGRLLDVSSEERTIEVLKAIVKAEKRFDFFFANAGVTNYRYVCL